MITLFKKQLKELMGWSFSENYWWVLGERGLIFANSQKKDIIHRFSAFQKLNSIVAYVLKHILNYPAPITLNLSWTFGSLCLMALVIQIVSGYCLTMHYVPQVDLAFDSVEHIMRDVKYGYALRYVHANGASFYFVCIYCHIFRSLYYKTFIKNGPAWQIGVVILLLSMATAFLGYVLPWGQMSFWGATVITNLFSVIPFIGPDLVYTMWGGYGVGNPTLSRFYSLHFLLPLVILWLVVVHTLLLHDRGSSTPNKPLFGIEKVSFIGFFGLKDLYLLSYGIIVFALFLVFGPNVLNHPDNYNQADPMQTPPHIVPEWYFLPFYAILRAIPNKTMGVVAMAVSILIFMVLPSKRKLTKPKYSNNLQLLEKSVFWAFFVNSIFLGYLGGMPIEWPYNVFSLIFCGAYFILVLLLSADLEQYALRGNENFEMYMLRQTKRAYDCYSENIPSLVFDLYFIVVALVSVNLGWNGISHKM